MPFHQKHSRVETGPGFFTSTIHSEDVFKKGITFIVKYLGSISISKPRSRFEIISAMNKARTEFRHNDMKKTKVVIKIGIEGINVRLWSSKKKHPNSDTVDDENLPLLLHHPMFRVYYVTLDSYDLKIFSYFVRDGISDTRFRCNVFKSISKSQAMHVVRTIGQAFEVCNKFKDSHTSNHSDVEEDVTNAAATTNTSTMNNKRNTRSVRSRAVNGLDDVTVRVSDESQDDSDNSFKDLNDDFSNLQFDKKLKSGLSKSVERLTSIPSSGSRNTSSPGGHMYSMSDTLPRCSKQKTINDFLRQNSLPSVTINDDTMAEYKITNYEWLLVTARLEHEIQETQAAVSQVKLLQNQLQAEKSARIEAQDLIDQLLSQNRELLSHISTLIQQLGNKNGDARSCSIEKSRSPQSPEDRDNYTGNHVKYLTLPSKSPSSSSSSPLLSNHKNNNHKLMEALQANYMTRPRKQRSITRNRTIIEEDPINSSSHLASITRSFSEKLPQRNLNVLAQMQRSQWARHTTK